MATTKNYGLFVTNTGDDLPFKEWRNNMSASSGSNMVKIDEALGDLRDEGEYVRKNGVGAVVWDNDASEFLVYNMNEELIQTIPLQIQTPAGETEAIQITSFDCGNEFAEIGDVITEIRFRMAFNPSPSSVTLNGENIGVRTVYVLKDISVSSDTVFTLRASDRYGNIAQKTCQIKFVDAVYYGAATAPDVVDSAFMSVFAKQGKVLTNSREHTIEASASEDEYIWYCCPTNLGACTFSVCGFRGGFSLIDTIEFVNDYGHKANYNIYRSDNTGLANLPLEVS